MTPRLWTIFVFLLAAVGSLNADTLTLLTLNDGLGNSVSIDETGTVSGSGSFVTFGSLDTGAHKTLAWAGMLGQFDLNVTTGRGGAAEVRPALMNLNSINAASAGPGTLNILFADSGYTDLASRFTMGVSGTETAFGSSVLFTAAGRVNEASPILTIGSLGPFTSSSFSKTKDFYNPVGSHGILGEELTLHFARSGDINTSFTLSNARSRGDDDWGEISNNPELSTITLFGSVLLFAGNALRRKLLRQV